MAWLRWALPTLVLALTLVVAWLPWVPLLRAAPLVVAWLPWALLLLAVMVATTLVVV